MPLDTKVRTAGRSLCRELDGLRFGAPVTHVYNPMLYARGSYARYVDAYGSTTKRVLFLGMNPGPFGMVQTGVPFGDVGWVRDWLGIEAVVSPPEGQHPKRPIQGFGCARREVSGGRLWGAIADHWKTPKRFFARHFVINYCPLAFLEASGRNRTPDKLPRREREPLFEACDRHLRRLVALYEPRWIVGVGTFAESRARASLANIDVSIGRVLHPSPASPLANRDWAGQARRELVALGVCDGR